MTTRVTRARRPKDVPLLALEPLPAKGDLQKVNKRRHGHVLEDSEMSEQETSQDPSYVPPKRSNRDPRMFRAGRAAVAPQSPSKVSPKTGRMMEMHTGKVLQAEGSKAPAAADKVAEAQADKKTLQREKRSPPPKRGPGRPPNPKLGAPGKKPAAVAPTAPLEHAEASLRAWTKEQHENRKRAEDALVREAQRTGRFVDLAVHSFQASMPPSRLVVPEGVSVDFVRRQIQYRVEEHGGELTADAIELQLKDNCGMMVPAVSFDSRGREMTIAEYGLKPGPPGAQHHIWALFVDDSAARIQRNAVDRILQPTGASNLARAARPVAVVEYEAALSPPRSPPQAAAATRREQAQADAAVRHDQQMQEAVAGSPSPGRKRGNRNTRWTAEETEVLIDSVTVHGTGSWADILAQHRAIFHPIRTSVDLKDKWRNLVKAAQKPADAETRTQFLTREQIVKILEYLHQDDE